MTAKTDKATVRQHAHLCETNAQGQAEGQGGGSDGDFSTSWNKLLDLLRQIRTRCLLELRGPLEVDLHRGRR